MALRRVAQMLPAGAVAAMSIFCRTPNAYPLAADVGAEPLSAAGGWG